VNVNTDILILGVGTSGSTLVKFLKDLTSEKTIAICDTRVNPWTHVVCGELIPDPSSLSNIPKTLLEYMYKSHNIIMENTKIIKSFKEISIKILDREFIVKFKSYIIDKSELIKNLIGKNIQYYENYLGFSAFSYEVHNDGIKIMLRNRDGDIKYVKARFVICSDSFPSILYDSQIWNFLKNSKYLTISCISLQAKLSKHIENPKIIINPKIAPGGYAWIFPKDEYVANVGLGINTDFINSIVEYLDKFLKIYNLKPVSRVLCKTLPVDGVIYSDRLDVVYVGDAGGFVIPTNGAGINPAIISSLILYESNVDSEVFREKSYNVIGNFINNLARLRKPFDKILVNYSKFERFFNKLFRRSVISNLSCRLLFRFVTGCLGFLDLLGVKFASYLSDII